MVGIILKFFDLGTLRRCEKNHKVFKKISEISEKFRENIYIGKKNKSSANLGKVQTEYK